METKDKEYLKKQACSARLKKLIIFDLDGTLAKSKLAIDKEMASLFAHLLDEKLVAVIGGGAYSQFQNQLLAGLSLNEKQLANLFIFPTSGSIFYRWQKGSWVKVYEHALTSKEIKKIMAAFDSAFTTINYSQPTTTYGKIIENRGTQVTFSALGQEAPVAAKEEWNKVSDQRKKIKTILEKYLSEFEVRLGGLTSIDITRKGVDKAFGVEQIMQTLNITKNEIIFIGDALYEGGNDHAVKKTGVETVEVSDPTETSYFISNILHNSSSE